MGMVLVPGTVCKQALVDHMQGLAVRKRDAAEDRTDASSSDYESAKAPLEPYPGHLTPGHVTKTSDMTKQTRS